jgi:hypothetical protein
MAEFQKISGHFGEQQGDAGQKKTGLAPVPIASISDTDKLTDALFSAGITCEVIKVNWLQGSFMIYGSDDQREKAKNYLIKRYPGSQVSW